MRTFLLVILSLSTQFIQAQSKDSLDIMIGQMILIGVSGTSVNANDPSLIAVKEGKAGSIIFFEKNIAKENSFNTMKKLVDDLQAAASIPLIISIDQEGGRVNRLKEKYGFPKSVTHKYLGKLGNTDSTYYYSNAMAANLAALGINMNFAPVVDLETEKANPIIAKYGSADWLKDFISNPGSSRHYSDKNSMPAFETKMTDRELDLLVRWMTHDYHPTQIK